MNKIKGKQFFLILFFINYSFCSFSQNGVAIQWQKSIGGDSSDFLFTIKETSDKGFIISGNSNSPISGDKSQNSWGKADYWIIKLDSLGIKQWDKTIGGSDDDFLRCVQPTSDGGYILGGDSYSGQTGLKSDTSRGAQDYWIIKVDGTGNIQWQKTIGGNSTDVIRAINQTIDGNYILGGYSNSNISGEKSDNSLGFYDFWIIKLDGTGNILWQKTIGGGANDYLLPLEIKQTIDEGFILGGTSFSQSSLYKSEDSFGGSDYWVVKLDSIGNLEWENTIGGDLNDDLRFIQQTYDGSYILAGNSNSNANISTDKQGPSFGGHDFWVVKLNNSGQVTNYNIIGGIDADTVYCIRQTSDSGFIVGGSSYSSISGNKSDTLFGQSDYWILKLNANTAIEWQQTFGGDSLDNLRMLEQTIDGGFILGGWSASGISGNKTVNAKGGVDNWIIKLTPEISFPQVNNALHFDGVDDFINIPHDPLLNLTNFTIEAWVKTTISKPFGRLITKPVGSDQNYSLIINNGMPHIRFDNINTGVQAEGSNPVNDGFWHHLAGVYDQNAGELKIFVDGKLEATTLTTSFPKTGTESLYININDAEALECTIDQVRIWNFARSQAEIQSNMNCEITTPQPGLVANYNFNHGIAGQDNSNPPVNILQDSSGNNFIGTLDAAFALTGTTSNWVESDSIKIAPIINPAGNVSIIAGDSIELSSYPSACLSFQWLKNNSIITGATNSNYFASDTGFYKVVISYGAQTDTSDEVHVNLFLVNPVENALDFDGNGDGVLLGTSPLFNSPTITIQAWVKPFSNSAWRGVVTKRGCCDEPTTMQWTLQTNPNNMGFVAKTTGPTISLLDPQPLLMNSWTQYSVTYDGKIACLYRNGILVDADSVTGSLVSLPSIPAYIGRRDEHTDNVFDFWEGTIDEVRIWSKALSLDEIQSNINCELTGTEDSLIAYYNFNQGIAGGNNIGLATLNDLSPNNLNGTLSNNFSLTGNTSNWVSSDSIKIVPVILQQDTIVICSGDSAILSTQQSSCYTFQWYKNGVALNGQTSSSISVIDSGFYSVRISYGNLTATSIDSVKVLMINSNSVIISPSGTINICNGNNITLTSNQVAGNSWNTGNTTQSITVTQPGNYFVVNGCDTSASVTVVVNAIPSTPFINASADSICFTETVVLTTDSSATGWLWSTGATTSTIQINSAGVYFVTVTNSFGCTSDVSNPDTIFSKSGHNYFKDQDSDNYGDNDSVVFACSQPIGYVINNTDCNDLIYSINPAAVDTCDGIDNNCDGIIDNVGGVIPLITGTRTVCRGNTIFLFASGAPSYSWYKDTTLISNSDTLQITNADSSDAGQYFIVFNFGCATDTLFESIFVVTPPEAFIAGLLNSYCLNGAGSLLTGIPTGGVFSLNVDSTLHYYPSSLGIDTTIYISPSYYGCPADTAIAITTVNASPALAIVSSTGSLILCVDSNITLNANSPATSYQWSTGSSLSNISINTTGIYTLTVTNIAGCSAQSSVSISSDPVPHITTGGGNAICTGDSILLSYNAATVLWSTSSNNNSIYFSYDSIISISKDTLVSVIGTSTIGCPYQDSITIRVNPGVTPTPVTNMYPPDSSFNLAFPITFSWLPGSFNTKYDLLIYDINDYLQTAINTIYNIGYTLTGGLNYGQTYKWKVVSHNGNCADTISSSQTFSVRDLPDLAILNTSVPSNLVAGSTISLSWQIVNLGNGNTGSTQWIDEVYLSANDSLETNYDQLLASHLNFSALDSFGVAYSDSLLFTTPINLIGRQYIIIKTDANNQLQETNNDNNIFISDSINIITPPLPDLRISSIAAQTNIFSGDTITVHYTVTNFGNHIATSLLRLDRFYVTANSLLDTIGIPIAANLGFSNDTLLPGQSKTYNSNDVVVPKYISGTYFVHVFTDATNQIFEGSAEGNNSGTDSINVFLTPPPDLVIHDLEITDTVASGNVILVKYHLRNDGYAPTDNYWYDGFFLSHDTIFSYSNAIPLKLVYHGNTFFDTTAIVAQLLPQGQLFTNNLGLMPGDDVEYLFGVPIPDTLTGTYNLFVYTDAFNNIFEYNKENNNILRRGDNVSGNTGTNQPVTFINPDLIVNFISFQDTVSAGLPVSVSWEIKNTGAGNLLNKLRKDAIYICDSSDFDAGNKQLLGFIEYDTPLSKNAVTSKQLSVTIPNGISGIRYLFVKTDYLNSVFESNQNNNVSAPEQIQIDITNWADVMPDTISFPDTLVTTLDFNFQNAVHNIGTLYANGSWTDALYISPSPIFDASATQVGSFAHSGNISVGSSYGFNQPIALPLTSDLVSGQDSAWYYFYYTANANNQLFENGYDTNNRFKSDSVFVYNKYVDHIVTSVITDDTAATYQTFNVQWIVKNIGFKTGSAYYNQWNDAVYFSMDTILDYNDTLIGVKSIYTTLNNNQVYTQNRNFQIPGGISGKRYIIVKTDYAEYIDGELVKNNNTNLKRDASDNPVQVFFDAPPPADLMPVSFTAPSSAVAGQPITIQFNVKNNGTGKAIPSSWLDQVFLSNGYNPAGTIIYNNNHNTGLDTNQTYTDSIQVFIPNNAVGNYVLVLYSDVMNQVYETSDANNFAYSIISIAQLPPTDLTASGIITPAAAQSGSTATISWNLKNASLNPAFGYTRQAVYLSQDTVWDSNDVLFGYKDTSVNMPAGTSIPFSITSNLNASLEGINYAIVRVDLLNNINESNESNNVSASDSINITIMELPIEIKTGDLLYNNNLQYYKLKTDTLAGETILLTVTGDTLNGNTELYISFGQSPTTANYDFADFNPYNKTKQIIIPEADSGNYYIAVKGNTTNGIAQADTLLAHILPFSISKVETNHGGNTGNVTVKISGSKFEQGMYARLVSVTGADTIGDFIPTSYFINSTAVWVTFQLNHKPQGFYHVQLIKPDNSLASLDSSFTIEAGNSGTFNVTGMGNTGMTGTPNAPGCDPGAGAGINQNLQVTVNHPYQERTGRNVPVTILYSNQSNVDIPVPTRLLVSEKFPVAWAPYFPNYNNKELTIEFSEPGSPPGILRAGASGGITFYTRVIGPILNHYYIK